MSRHDKLVYLVPPAQGFVALGDSFAHLVGRCGTDEWRRRCLASMRASRKRRDLDPDGGPVADRKHLASIYLRPVRRP
jgi:hypothetical protein